MTKLIDEPLVSVSIISRPWAPNTNVAPTPLLLASNGAFNASATATASLSTQPGVEPVPATTWALPEMRSAFSK